MLKNNGFHNRKRLYFSPNTLFANGEQGAWYDPSDMSTMFQDSAGTTPVTAVGQPVGRILDKSGRGNHAFQTTTTKRPLYQSAGGYSYLAFDGVDDALVTNSINFTATDKMTVWTGMRKLSDATGIITELSAIASSNNGSFLLYGAGTTIRWANKGSTPFVEVTSSALTPVTKVITGIASISTDVLTIRNNSVEGASNPTDQGTGNYGNYPLYIGSRGGTSLPFNGNLYSLIVRGAQSNDYQIAATEQYSNSKTGAF
jgi:hypothetical protein